jgi:hypothetical protein
MNAETRPRAERPEEVDVLLARAFAAQDVEACAAVSGRRRR